MPKIGDLGVRHGQAVITAVVIKNGDCIPYFTPVGITSVANKFTFRSRIAENAPPSLKKACFSLRVADRVQTKVVDGRLPEIDLSRA